MISVYGYTIALPTWLAFLAGDFGSFIGTIITSFILALGMYIAIFFILNWFFRKTDTEIDDVILGASRWPFVVLAVLFGLERSTEVWGTNGFVGWIEKTLWFFIVLNITWWIARVFKEAIVYQLKVISENSEAAWDDVLVPVVERLVPPVIWTIGIVIALGFFEVDLTGLYVAIGGTAFILGFALQDILSNLFGGLVLLLDTPFKYNDVIKLEDGTITIIKRIGLRVTHLYNTQDHSDIFIPNSVLGSTNIINITRPTTDLVASLTVGVGYASDIKYVRSILGEIINGHPDVLGDIDTKLNYLKRFHEFTNGANKKEPAEKRLKAEQGVNITLNSLEGQLLEFSTLASTLEKGGINDKEQERIRSVYFSILETIGLLPVQKPKKWLSRAKWQLQENKAQSGLIEQVKKWYTIWLEDPDLIPEDTEGLTEEWNHKLLFLKLKVEDLFHYVMNPIGHERRLDNDAKEMVRWLHDNFKQSSVMWKEPDIRLIDFSASSLDIEISFFVDNIKLEHWERADRIKDELRREIKRRFDEAKIEIPFPQTDVWFRNTLSTIVDKPTSNEQKN